jgi:FPC/CPF motif-containing protein YcgG
MNAATSASVVEAYLQRLRGSDFPCIAAKTAVSKEQIRCMVADHLACPKDDEDILKFLYDFVDEYRKSTNIYNSAAVIFRGPDKCNEEIFDRLLWQRLQAISDLDAARYEYDKRVDADPSSSKFSYSIKQEAFYVIGLHPSSSRKARRFDYPTLVFNAHDQFEKLRATNKYEPMKRVVRRRDEKLSGSVNPMLSDFGAASEVFQYSGRKYDKDWKCPFVSHHGKPERDSRA